MLPDLSSLRIAASDLNGRMRGKRLPADFMRKVENGAVRMPLSVLNVDIWGGRHRQQPTGF
jgi:glutamine synthetase